MNCTKRKYDLIGAQLALAKCIWKSNLKLQRQEIRYYYCAKCKVYHLTKKKI